MTVFTNSSEFSRQYRWATSWKNQQNDLCAQQKIGSAWASAQSEQSLCCPHEETWGPQLHIERTAKTDQTGMIWVFAGRTDHFDTFYFYWVETAYNKFLLTENLKTVKQQ